MSVTYLEFKDLINSANGSPNQLLKNIEIWNDFSDEIISKLDYPIKNNRIFFCKFKNGVSECLPLTAQLARLSEFVPVLAT